MEAKIDALQAQFPASFPDSFKTLFAMVGEDEDHWDMFSTLLEDKVIPRASRINPRRFGGSLRCTQSTPSQNYCRDANVVTRSSSFRLNRPRLNTYGRSYNVANTWTDIDAAKRETSQQSDDNSIMAESNKLFCKHTQYCCLHQQQVQQQRQSAQPAAIQMTSYANKPQDFFQNFMESADETRLGPDGEDTINIKPLIDTTNAGLRRPSYPTQEIKASNCFECIINDHGQANGFCTIAAAPAILKAPLKPILKNATKKIPPSNQSIARRQTTMLPQVPQEIGATHTKEQALQRVQQQFGLYKSKGNSNFSRSSMSNIAEAAICNDTKSNDATLVSFEHDLSSNEKQLDDRSRNEPKCNLLASGNKTFTQASAVQAVDNDLIQLSNAENDKQALVNMKFNFGKGVSSSTCDYCHMHDFPIQIQPHQNTLFGITSTTSKTKNNTSSTLSDVDEINLHDFGTDWDADNKSKDQLVSDKQTKCRRGFANEETLQDCDQTFGMACNSNNKPPSRSSHRADGAVCTTMGDKKNLRCANVTLTTEPDNGVTCKDNLFEKKVSGNNNEIGYKETAALEVVEETTPVAADNDLCFFQDTLNATHTSATPNTKNSRTRTSSMPEGRKPRLADMRRTAIHCADMDLEYYRLRSFSITSHGVCNLGDSLRRRSRSNNSVTSTGTSNSGRERRSSNASRVSGEVFQQDNEKDDNGQKSTAAYKIAMLGSAGVGKTTLSYQFTTSDYICAYDLSLDDDYGQKTVSVLVDGVETDLEIIDHPACEMSVEAFCSTYRIDLFVVVYSVVDRTSFKAAEKTLQYLKENEMLLTRGAILVGNKTDLERHREVTTQMGRKVAKDIACKFIETSSGLDHNVDELLVGIVAQVKLNPERIRNLNDFDRQRLVLHNSLQDHGHVSLANRRFVRQISIYHAENDADIDNALEDQSKLVVDECTENENEDIRPLDPQNLARSKIKERFDPTAMLTERNKKDKNAKVHSLNNSPKRSSRHASDVGGKSFENLKESKMLNKNLLQEDRDSKSAIKLSDRTKGFFSSVLKLKKAMNIKRRNSSSCSDLFVI